MERSAKAGDIPPPTYQLNDVFKSLWLSRDTNYEKVRQKVGRFFWQSPQIRRCYEKPRGYAGDFLMMDFICNGHPVAETEVGKWIDDWFRDDFPGTQSVRNRRAYMGELLSFRHQKGARRILNVACGGAPEFALLPKHVSFEKVVLLDQDEGALAFAQQSIGEVHGDGAKAFHLQPVCTRVKSLLQDGVLGAERFDLIYSMGLYDYLLRDAARALTLRLWNALAPGGVIAIGNYQGDHWGRYVVEALMDWFLIYRDKKDLLALSEGLPGAVCEVTTDATGLVHILQISKPVLQH